MIIYRNGSAVPKEKLVHIKSTSHPNPAKAGKKERKK